MHVLQHAAAVVGRRNAQVLLIPLVPRLGQVGRLKLVVQQRPLQLEPNEDVQVVRGFVGLDANQRRPNVVDGEMERIERHVAQRRREILLGLGIEVRPERPAAADQILPHPRLRLVNAQRDEFAQRQPEMLDRQALIVDAVARFVQNAEKRRIEELLVVAGRDAAVVRAQASSKTDGRSRRAARG